MRKAPSTGRGLVPGFADMIRRECGAKGWSLNELARVAGVSANTVSAVTREVRAPSLRVASALVTALGVSVWLHDPAVVAAPTRSQQPAEAGDEPGSAENPKTGGEVI